MSMVTDKCPVLGLDQDIPDQLYIVMCPVRQIYAFARHDGVIALNAFTDALDADGYMKRRCVGRMVRPTVVAVTFDEARKLAKSLLVGLQNVRAQAVAVKTNGSFVLHYVR